MTSQNSLECVKGKSFKTKKTRSVRSKDLLGIIDTNMWAIP